MFSTRVVPAARLAVVLHPSGAESTEHSERRTAARRAPALDRRHRALSWVVFTLLVLPGAIAPGVHAQCPVAEWVQGTPGTNGNVNALTVLADGDVVAGGAFNMAGDVNIGWGIARYSPATNTWSALGSGINNFGVVHSLTVLPDGDVVAGGQFTSAGGVNIGYGIARYSPATNTWSALGSGISNFGVVQSLAVLPGGDLIAGGQFTSAGGVAANNIARYSPASDTWSALGSGINGSADALAVLPGGDVIVGGLFDTAGGVAANAIARYSPSTDAWSALGSGLTITGGSARALALTALPSGDVIVGGIFFTAGGVNIGQGIARYNPATDTWSGLGSGMNDVVRALAALPGGDLIAGGHFTATWDGDVSASRIARYNATTDTWSALGSGVSNWVLAVAALPDGDVIAGGTFTAAGGMPASRFARHTFGGTAPSISGQPQDAATCSSGTATFSVTAAGEGGGAFTYQWQLEDASAPGEWADLSDGPVVRDGQKIGAVEGAQTAVLEFTLFLDDGAPVRVRAVVSNDCGSVTSDPAGLTLCSADYTCDGGVNSDDYFAFLTDFFAGDADFDGSGVTDSNDYFAFLAAFFEGCV